MSETVTVSDLAAVANSARAEGERIAAITGARFCIQCGFNLTGQIILREPEYGLLIARCPECGTVAPLQEYPPLSAWSRRWAVMLAVLWFAVVSLLTLGTAALTSAITSSLSWRQTYPLSTHISEAWAPVIGAAIAAVRANDGSADALSPSMLTLAQQYQQWYTSGTYTDAQIQQWISQGAIGLDREWWRDTRAAVLAGTPGAGWGWVRDEPLVNVALWLLLALGAGAAWSAILLQHRLRSRLIFAALVGALAALILWSSRPDPFALATWGGQANAWSVAQAELWPQAAAIAVVIVSVPFLIGLLFGRPIIRLLARLFLTPRMCLAIAPLWLCDGRNPPQIRDSASTGSPPRRT